MTGASWGRLGRVVALVAASCSVFLGSSIAIVQGLERAEARRPRIPEGLEPLIRLRTEQLGEMPAYRQRVAYFSDSIGMSTNGRDGVAQHLQAAVDLETGTPSRIGVVPFAFAGADAPTFYFAADEISAGRPDHVLMGFNLAWLSREWYTRTTRIELAGMVAPARLPAVAALPLHRFGLTYDRWALLLAIEKTGLEEAWTALRRQQARVPYLLHDTRVAWHIGGQRAEPARLMRTIPVGGQHYSGAYAGAAETHPMLRVTEALIAYWVERGVDVTVFVDPIDVQRHRTFPWLSRAGLRKSIDSVERVVRRAGGRYLDRHELFATATFKDVLGHFETSPVNGRKELAASLVQPVLTAAGL